MFNLKFKKFLTAGILSLVLILTSIPLAQADETIGECKAGSEITETSSFVFTQFIIDNTNLTKAEEVQVARIVELSESLPGTDSVGDSYIIDAYKGICCPQSNIKGSQCTSYIEVYATTLSDCEDVGYLCSTVQLLVSDTGINMLKFYALQIYVWAAGIIGIIAVLVIAVSGLQIAASGGEEQMTSAKTRIMQSLAGLAILFLSALILYTINPTFFTK